MERTMLSFNMPNTITVVAMVAIGYAALTFGAWLVGRAGYGPGGGQ